MAPGWVFLPGLSEKQLGSYVWASDVRLIEKTSEGATVFLSSGAYANMHLTTATSLTAEEVLDILDAAYEASIRADDAREDAREDSRNKGHRC